MQTEYIKGQSQFLLCNKQDVDKETQNYVVTNSLWTDGAPEAVRLQFSCKMVAI